MHHPPPQGLTHAALVLPALHGSPRGPPQHTHPAPQLPPPWVPSTQCHTAEPPSSSELRWKHGGVGVGSSIGAGLCPLDPGGLRPPAQERCLQSPRRQG